MYGMLAVTNLLSHPQPRSITLMALDINPPATDWHHDSVLVGSSWDEAAAAAAEPEPSTKSAGAPLHAKPSASTGLLGLLRKGMGADAATGATDGKGAAAAAPSAPVAAAGLPLPAQLPASKAAPAATKAKAKQQAPNVTPSATTSASETVQSAPKTQTQAQAQATSKPGIPRVSPRSKKAAPKAAAPKATAAPPAVLQGQPHVASDPAHGAAQAPKASAHGTAHHAPKAPAATPKVPAPTAAVAKVPAPTAAIPSKAPASKTTHAVAPTSHVQLDSGSGGLEDLLRQQLSLTQELMATVNRQQSEIGELRRVVGQLEGRVVTGVEQSVARRMDAFAAEARQARKELEAVEREKVRRLLTAMQDGLQTAVRAAIESQKPALVQALATKVEQSSERHSASLAAELTGALKTQISTALAAPEFLDPLAKHLNNGIKKSITGTFTRTVKESVIPATQGAVGEMFTQVSTALEQGLGQFVTQVRLPQGRGQSPKAAPRRPLTFQTQTPHFAGPGHCGAAVGHGRSAAPCASGGTQGARSGPDGCRSQHAAPVLV
jgi:Meckel syndrome type 1 protein